MTDDVLSRLIVQTGARLEQTSDPSRVGAGRVLDELGVTTIQELPPELRGAPEPERPDGSAAAFGRYRIGSLIGRGAAGEVYEAYDPELRRWAAVKVLRPEITDKLVLERFVAEAHVTAQLEHPGIVPVHDFGVTDEGRVYFVMQRVRGRSLFQILGGIARGDEGLRREWTPYRRLTALVQICRAVGYAHERGVVHRDLKPSNLMFGAHGEALVMDWGIARVLENASEPVDRHVAHHTAAGAAIGTIGYMSPEQMMGAHDALGPSSDVWSLGIILYEAMTIRRAYKGSLQDVCERASRGPLAVDGLVPDPLAPGLAQIIQDATAVKIHDRYPNGTSLGAAIDRFVAESESRW